MGLPVRAARLWSISMLLLLAALAGGLAALAGRHGGLPWPLGGVTPGAEPFDLVQILTAGGGLLLGWFLPGVPLALAVGAPARLLWPRALGLGTGYVVLTSGAWAAIFGGLPPASVQLALLALPCIAAIARPRPVEATNAGLAAMLAASFLLATLLWPKLALESLNGDGTESYELARSLFEHALPHWDMERPEGGGRFGIPAVNPFVTNSYLAGVRLSLMGTGEVAVRLTLIGALLAGAAITRALAPGPDASARGYVAAITAVYALWGAYYVGYERAFADLAEPLGTNTLMVALWMAGIAEVVHGSAPLGVSFLFLASGVLYSAPVLGSTALAALAMQGHEGGRRALKIWIAGLLALALLVAAFGVWTGDGADWIRQVRSEYWNDFVDQARRTPTLPMLGLLVLATGGLPLAALAGWRSLSPLGRALLATGGVYLILVAASRYKNLHYLAPLPFLLAVPALEASRPRWRLAAIAVAAATFVLSWPHSRAVHRENTELGSVSCLGGVDVPTASLGGDVVYAAFQPPGAGPRFGVGKHTFVRYAADLGRADDCVFRLGAPVPDGWIAVASRTDDPTLVLATRDVDAYARWRLSTPPMPSSVLFPAPGVPAIPGDAAAWAGRVKLRAQHGALLVDGFRDEPPSYVAVARWPVRLLLPSVARRIRWRSWTGEGGLALDLRVNGAPAGSLHVPPGWSEVDVGPGPAWRAGWNLVELAAPRPDALLTLDWIEIADGGAP